MPDITQSDVDKFRAMPKERQEALFNRMSPELKTQFLAVNKERLAAKAKAPGMKGSGGVEAIGEFAKETAVGAGKTAMQGPLEVSKLIHKIPGVGETLAPSAGITAGGKVSETKGLAQAIGAGAETALEYVAGEGALKTMTTALRLKDTAMIARLVSKYPKLGAIAEAGMKAFGLGTAQAALHGEDHPMKSGKWTALASALGETVSEGLKMVPKKAESAAMDAVNRWIGLLPGQMAKSDRENVGEARKVARTVYEESGIKHTLEGQKVAIEDARGRIQAQTDKLIIAAKGRLVPLHAELQEINSRLSDKMEKAGQLTDQALNAINSNYKQFWGSHQPNVSVQEALNLRRIINKEINWNTVQDTLDIRQKYLEEMYHTLNRSIRRALGPEDAGKFSHFNELQQRLILARQAIGKKEFKESLKDIGQWGPGMIKRAVGGAAVGAGVGAETSKEKEGQHPIAGAVVGAVAGAIAGPKSQARIAKALEVAAPKLAYAARKSPALKRAIDSATAAHGGGSGSVSAP